MSHTTDLSINLATIRAQCDLRAACEACARHGIAWVAPWRDQLAATGLAEAARILAGNGLKATGLCRGGMFTTAPDALDDNRRAIDEAAAIGATHLVLVVGGLPAGSRDLAAARRRVADGLAALLPYARAAGMPLAIEPLHPMYAPDRACVNTLAQALDLCDALGDGVGVVLDTYHLWWDPELWPQIARAGRDGRILAHHISDFLVPTRDLLNDRGMMGDGVIDFPAFRRAVAAAGFGGPQEVEIFSTEWAQKPGEAVIATCIERFNSVC
ncbi:MAG: endonuclease [Devosia sp. 67-54]|uniref:sugar phosphate isomerase/epimerase family protein n=1 Tax=unclassified Devosia TaxID=196773 RepID=UPI00095DF959|nr:MULTISPECIES: sugar phosphate isomerase/epimerase family protein [unclassified Devosia]MBN9307393.1 sugar phosphate isomerase/epimerase [Devosia sp.]OJX19701.1 MAG: endonuclease [Devosia sp. 67-54]